MGRIIIQMQQFWEEKKSHTKSHSQYAATEAA